VHLTEHGRVTTSSPGERVRRFELIEKNAAKFWAIAREREVLVTHWGKIGAEGKQKKKICKDFMVAEQEYDRLIRQKIRGGYDEVQQPTEAVIPLPDRTLELVTLDDEASFLVKPKAFRYMVWRMIEIGLIDRHAKGKDLTRWDRRAARRAGLEETPEPEHEKYEEWEANWLRLSEADRSDWPGALQAAGWKYLEGSHWVVNPEECNLIAEQVGGVTPKRHKASVGQQTWVDEWVAWHKKAAKVGGYIVYAEG
jgi:predicted DNA-binding WGR domain protein